MGIISANKIKCSESFSKQPNQLIVELNSSLWQIIVTKKKFQYAQPKYLYILSHVSEITIFLNIHPDKINGILYPKLFWPTVRKNCSSDWEQLLEFKAEGWDFAKFLRSLEQ